MGSKLGIFQIKLRIHRTDQKDSIKLFWRLQH
jgi:hypothetical protein